MSRRHVSVRSFMGEQEMAKLNLVAKVKINGGKGAKCQ